MITEQPRPVRSAYFFFKERAPVFADQQQNIHITNFYRHFKSTMNLCFQDSNGYFVCIDRTIKTKWILFCLLFFFLSCFQLWPNKAHTQAEFELCAVSFAKRFNFMKTWIEFIVAFIHAVVVVVDIFRLLFFLVIRLLHMRMDNFIFLYGGKKMFANKFAGRRSYNGNGYSFDSCELEWSSRWRCRCVRALTRAHLRAACAFIGQNVNSPKFRINLNSTNPTEIIDIWWPYCCMQDNRFSICCLTGVNLYVFHISNLQHSWCMLPLNFYSFDTSPFAFGRQDPKTKLVQNTELT